MVRTVFKLFGEPKSGVFGKNEKKAEILPVDPDFASNQAFGIKTTVIAAVSGCAQCDFLYHNPARCATKMFY
jgi:hypothetical protein